MKKFDHTQLHTNIFAHTKIEYIILFHIGTIVQKMMIPLKKRRNPAYLSVDFLNKKTH